MGECCMHRSLDSHTRTRHFFPKFHPRPHLCRAHRRILCMSGCVYRRGKKVKPNYACKGGGGGNCCACDSGDSFFSAPRKSSSFHSPLFFLLCNALDYDRSPASSLPLTYPSCFSACNAAAAACALCNCQTQEGGKIIMQFSCQKPRIGLRNDGSLLFSCLPVTMEGGGKTEEPSCSPVA